MKNRTLFSAAGLVFIGLFLLFAVALISALPGWRIDLTEDNLYTLSPGTRNIVSNLEEPVELLFFYSEDATTDVPQLRSYANRVQELLREMVIASDGRLSLRVVDPEPFSVEEDLAAEYGIQAVPLTAGGEEVYFGLVASEPGTAEEEQEVGVGDRFFETMPLIRPDQEEFLEYEFSRLITRVANPEPPVVAYISTLDVDGGFDPAIGQSLPPWTAIDSIGQSYELRALDPGVRLIEDDVDTLLVIHPQDLDEQTLYAIDQFVLGGGQAMVFVDPSADSQRRPGSVGEPLSSDLGPLLENWGVGYDSTQVVGDEELAIRVTVGQARRSMPHLGMLSVERQGLASNDIVTGRLENINLSSSGVLSPLEGARTEFTPLIQSSDSAGLLDAELFWQMDDPSILLDEFEAGSGPLTLAARVQGEIYSAFPGGRPQTAAQRAAESGVEVVPMSPQAQAEAEQREAEEERLNRPHLERSQSEVNLIIVADSDLLTDRLWVRMQNYFGERVAQPFANNGDFVINAMDNLSGSPELVSIRGRGRYSRPFTRVMDLQREADEQLRQEEAELMRSLQETEEQLAALNQGPEGELDAGPTPAQQEEIDRFIQEQLETRRRLREVRLRLNRDIENLGSTLKAVNTLFIPVLLTIAVLVFAFLRSRRRRRAAAER